MKEIDILKLLENESKEFILNYLKTNMKLQEILDTPPTVDEVCAKLSEYLEEQITYESGSFFNERKTAEVCAIGNLGLIYFNVHLPLNIASDIIKFYEGLQ